MSIRPSKGPEKSPSVTSPCLSSFYIYNPLLGRSDETAHEQLIFHYSINADKGSSEGNSTTKSSNLHRELRAIGLAQGIVQFAKAFSPDAPMEEVRTRKGFSVVIEVERNWWILGVRLCPTLLIYRRLKPPFLHLQTLSPHQPLKT
jgi:hypothetical protein